MPEKNMDPERLRKVPQSVRHVGASVEKACCGEPMHPRLAQAIDRNGERFTIAIWYCSHCGRAVY